MAQARRAQMLVDGSNACMSILQDRLRCIDPTVTLTLRLVLNSSCEALSFALEACEKYFFTSGQAPNAKKFLTFSSASATAGSLEFFTASPKHWCLIQ